MSRIFDIAQYGFNNAETFIENKKGRKVRCQHPNHKDRKPSAHVYEDHVYCFSCGSHFFFSDLKSSKIKSEIVNENIEKAKNYHNSLISSENQSNIRKFLKSRGINDDIAKDFSLGFHNNALVFPIKNIWGNINGFGFRNIKDQEPKYWNDADKDNDEKSLFCKSSNLYGIDKISDDCENLVICEGYIDVISAYKNDFKNKDCFVAIMGAAFNEKHVNIIKHVIKAKKIKNISLMLDNDGTGQSSTIKAIKEMLSGDIYPDVIYNFKDKPDYKDVDELLKKENGKEILQELLEQNCHDWYEYLVKKLENSKFDNKQNDFSEIRECINCIVNKGQKSFYASKLCSIADLYKNLKLNHEPYPDILSLDNKKIEEFFLREENYSNFKLPKYFTFKSILKWAQEELLRLEKSNNGNFPYAKFKEKENVNYKILGNKNGEYAWRKYEIINPILYLKLVNEIAANYNSIKERLHQINASIADKIKCASIPACKKEKNDKFSNNTARQIVKWWDEMEQESIKKSLEYKYITQTDIVDCYGSIYTHSISWALHDREFMKCDNNRKDLSFIGNKIDSLLQSMNNGQTIGIPQGSVAMDFIAEILLKYVDLKLYEKCKKDNLNEYHILRYRDDYRIFTNEISISKKILKLLSESLIEVGSMRLSVEKTSESNCIISAAIKKDKLHYFESFKEHNSLKKDILNIYLFSKKYPNSGTMLKLLQLFDKKLRERIGKIAINLLSNKKIDDKLVNFDPKYIISILSEIIYLHPRTYAVACSIIFHILSVMNDKDRYKIWQNVIKKMKDVPNNESLLMWLERAVYIKRDNKEEWESFFEYCKNNKTLLYSAYSKENSAIWNFPENVDTKDLDVSKILKDEVKEKLDKAYNKKNQSIDVNESFTLDEISPFEYDSLSFLKD